MFHWSRMSRSTGVALVFGFAVASASVLPAAAQSDPVAERKALFKQIAAAMKEPGQMLKGEIPFNAETVKQGLTIVAANADKLQTLFPDGSGAGATAALPAVWENKADFNARLDKMNKDAVAAIVSINDAKSLTSGLPKVLGNCGACHKIYRKPS